MDRRTFIKAATLGAVGAAISTTNEISARTQRGKIETGTESQASRKAAHKLLESQYKQVKELKRKEEEIKTLFGNFYGPYKAKTHMGLLRELEDTITRQLDRGEKAIVKDIVSEHRVFPEDTQDTVVDSLNTKDGILDKKTFEKILQKTFPKGWVNKKVKFIRQEKFDRQLKYKGMTGNSLATCIRDANARVEIYFYKCAEKEEGRSVIKALCHELAHANDWKSYNEMTATERADLILNVYECMGWPHHFKSSYVESIAESDPHENNYYKVSEYWAEICQQYFTDHTKLNMKDFRLVDAFVRKVDPTFDIVKARTLRESLTPGYGVQKKEVSSHGLADLNKNVTRMVHRTMDDGSQAIVIEPVSQDDPLFYLARKEFLERNGYEVA